MKIKIYSQYKHVQKKNNLSFIKKHTKFVQTELKIVSVKLSFFKRFCVFYVFEIGTNSGLTVLVLRSCFVLHI